jgi:4'-phosphopantetheinyl transferase
MQLDGTVPLGPSARDVLSADERERLDRMQAGAHRQRFLAAHVFVRGVLSRYLGIEPGALKFLVMPGGKPVLEGSESLHFNLAHSSELAVLAVGPSPVGIDIEQVRDVADARGLARRYFSSREVSTLDQVPDGELARAFLTYWTQKEAVVKADGRGLAIPLQHFTVSGDATRPALLELDGDTRPRWSLSTIQLGPGYVGTLAVRDSLPVPPALLPVPFSPYL